MRYSTHFIDQLRQSASVSSVIGARIAVKRHGREFQALCPFHKEKSPSFTINDEKGFYHCFGCGAHGDAINFIKEYDGVGYKEAIEKLAGELGFALPQLTYEAAQEERRRKNIQEINELACQWFELQLQSTHGYIARDYIQSRGLTAQTIQRFRLGYAPDDRQALKRFLLAEGVTQPEMVAAGLLIDVEGRDPYDRFRGRIMFPIRDGSSRVIAFGGRLLSADKTSQSPKYLNSPETDIFSKGQTLYNFDLARRFAQERHQIILCEGYMDVIALAQAGFDEAVAPLGTAVTAGQLTQLWQICDEPTICLDGDEAGMRAMRRAAETALPLLKPGKSLRFCQLPQGEDPDSLLRNEGRQAMQDRLKQAQPMVDVVCQQVLSKAATTPEERAGQEEALMQLAEQIVHPTVKAHYRAHMRQMIWARSNESAKNSGGMKRVNTLHISAQQALNLPSLPRTSDLPSYKQRAFIHCLALVVRWPHLLEQAAIEEAFMALDSANEQDYAVQQMIVDWVHSAPEPTSQALRHALRESAQTSIGANLWLQLEKQLPKHHLDDGDTVDSLTRSLPLWQHGLQAYRLACLTEECQQAEQEMARQMDESSYLRFVALKEEMERLQRQTQQWQQHMLDAEVG